MDDLKYKYLKNAKVATNRTENLKVLNEGVFKSTFTKTKKILNEGIFKSIFAATKNQEYDPSVHGGSLFSWAAHSLTSAIKKSANKRAYNKALTLLIANVLKEPVAQNAKITLDTKAKEFRLFGVQGNKKPQQSQSWVTHLIYDLYDILNRTQNTGIGTQQEGGTQGQNLNSVEGFQTAAGNAGNVGINNTTPSINSMVNSYMKEFMQTLNKASNYLFEVSTEQRGQIKQNVSNALGGAGNVRNAQAQALLQARNQEKASKTLKGTSGLLPQQNKVQPKGSKVPQFSATPEAVKTALNILKRHQIWTDVKGWYDSGSGANTMIKATEELGFKNVTTGKQIIEKLDLNKNPQLKQAIDSSKNTLDKEKSVQTQEQLNTLFKALVSAFNGTPESRTKEGTNGLIEAIKKLKPQLPANAISQISNIIVANVGQMEKAQGLYEETRRIGTVTRSTQTVIGQFKEVINTNIHNVDEPLMTTYNQNLLKAANSIIGTSRGFSTEWNTLVIEAEKDMQPKQQQPQPAQEPQQQQQQQPQPAQEQKKENKIIPAGEENKFVPTGPVRPAMKNDRKRRR